MMTQTQRSPVPDREQGFEKENDYGQTANEVWQKKDILSSFKRYWKVEQDKSTWFPIDDSPKVEKLAKDKGAMFLTTLATTSPDVDGIRRGDFHFDLDSTDPAKAIEEARKIIVFLDMAMGVKVSQVHVHLSGGKGVHGRIAAEIIGAVPGPFLHLEYKALAARITVELDLETIDMSLYAGGMGKMLRIPNVKRSNGHYKVPVTVKELMDMDNQTLLDMTKQPRELDWDEEPDLPTLADGLSELYQECREQVAQEATRPETPPLDEDTIALLKADMPDCIKAILALRGKTPGGNFHQYVFNLGTYFDAAGIDPVSAWDIAQEFVEGYQSNTYKTPKARADHFKYMARYLQGNEKYTFGCSYIKGLKLPGNLFECGGCLLHKPKELEFEEVTEATKEAEPEAKKAEPVDFALLKYSLKGRAEQMKIDMQFAQEVLKGLALLSQATVFYSKHNAGKTLIVLWLLIEAIKRGDVNPEDVFYINADDDYKGLVVKLEYAEKYGFHMLAPGHLDFKAVDLVRILALMVTRKQCMGKILILDTLKKFTDLMNKTKSSEFNTIVRSFVAQGGTLIGLAHVNKHRGPDGKPMYSGTSDVLDDFDCGYTIDIVTDAPDGTRTVKFENLKSRGDVVREASYSYNSDPKVPWTEKFNSVQEIGEDALRRAAERKRLDEQYKKNLEVIELIRECIAEGIVSKTELVAEVHKRGCLEHSIRKIKHVLEFHSGDDPEKNQFWKEVKGQKNAKQIELNL